MERKRRIVLPSSNDLVTYDKGVVYEDSDRLTFVVTFFTVDDRYSEINVYTEEEVIKLDRRLMELNALSTDDLNEQFDDNVLDGDYLSTWPYNYDTDQYVKGDGYFIVWVDADAYAHDVKVEHIGEVNAEEVEA